MEKSFERVYQPAYINTDTNQPKDRLVVIKDTFDSPVTALMILRSSRLESYQGLIISGLEEDLKKFHKDIQKADHKGRLGKLDYESLVKALDEHAKKHGVMIEKALNEKHHAVSDDAEVHETLGYYDVFASLSRLHKDGKIRKPSFLDAQGGKVTICWQDAPKSASHEFKNGRFYHDESGVFCVEFYCSSEKECLRQVEKFLLELPKN
jgi:hypothetical protein